MLLKFNVDGRIDGKLVYEAGSVYEIDDATGSATRWLKRGAVEVPFVELKKKEEPSVEVVEDVLEEPLVAISEAKVENKKGPKSKRK
jgi:hypothetical protein